jgi:hypothetical protein
MCDQFRLAADAEYTIRVHFSAGWIVDDVIAPAIEVQLPVGGRGAEDETGDLLLLDGRSLQLDSKRQRMRFGMRFSL